MANGELHPFPGFRERRALAGERGRRGQGHRPTRLPRGRGLRVPPHAPVPLVTGGGHVTHLCCEASFPFYRLFSGQRLSSP